MSIALSAASKSRVDSLNCASDLLDARAIEHEERVVALESLGSSLSFSTSSSSLSASIAPCAVARVERGAHLERARLVAAAADEPRERRDVARAASFRTSRSTTSLHLSILGDVRLVLPPDGAGLDVDDLHEEEVLHAAHVFGALVGCLDLAGDEVLRAELLAVLGDVRRVEDRRSAALDLGDDLVLPLARR